MVGYCFVIGLLLSIGLLLLCYYSLLAPINPYWPLKKLSITEQRNTYIHFFIYIYIYIDLGGDLLDCSPRFCPTVRIAEIVWLSITCIDLALGTSREFTYQTGLVQVTCALYSPGLVQVACALNSPNLCGYAATI